MASNQGKTMTLDNFLGLSSIPQEIPNAQDIPNEKKKAHPRNKKNDTDTITKSTNTKKTSPASNHQLFTPSEEQQVIIDAIKAGQNVAVNAVAGSGKTTTILGIATQCPESSILQVTYNRALKLEVEKKAKIHKLTNLKILTYHGLACSHYDYQCWTDDRITELIRKGSPLNKPATAIPFDIIIIDEVQDMTPLYFELMHKFMADIQRKIILGIMGDHLQGIYGFKGADERFLTLGESIFSAHQPMMRLTLNTSYRLTRPMAAFVNQVLLSSERIQAIKDGVPVSWVQMPKTAYGNGDSHLTKYIAELIKSRLSSSTPSMSPLQPDDIFILASSIKSRGAEPIKDLENALVSAGILCFVPVSDEAKLDERIIKDKVVFTTMHQSKGRERKLVIVYGFDASYYDVFRCRDKTATTKICPNLLYVAATRASQELVIIEHIDTHQPLPFLNMTHSQMGASSFIKRICHPQLENHHHIDRVLPLQVRDMDKDKPEERTVSDLIKFIDERTLGMLSEMLDMVYTTSSPPTPESSVDIPSDVKTGVRTYEQVADINGITIPALLFCSSVQDLPIRLQTSHDNYLWNFIRYRYLRQTTDDKRNSFIKSYIQKIESDGLATNDLANWLLLGNIYICANEGYNYKLKQITEYDWLTQQMISMCHKNIIQHIPPETGAQSVFELELGSQIDYSNNSLSSLSFKFQHDKYGVIKLKGRVDCVTPDAVWEFKCVDSLTLESRLQLAIYAWIWKRQMAEPDVIRIKLAEKINEKQVKTQAPEVSPTKLIEIVEYNLARYYSEYDALLETQRTTREFLFDRSRDFKLMNIRTGEVQKLDVNHHLLDEIMETILAAKLRIKEDIPDVEFIDRAHARIRKYIPVEFDYKTMTDLEAQEEADRPVLDF